MMIWLVVEPTEWKVIKFHGSKPPTRQAFNHPFGAFRNHSMSSSQGKIPRIQSMIHHDSSKVTFQFTQARMVYTRPGKQT